MADDAMIEDGALKGRKLLVIPNSSVTVTSRKAVNAIRRWVERGGTLIGFGRGCLAYTVENDRSVKATPGLAGLIPAAIIEDAERRPGAIKVERLVGKGRVVLYLRPADPGLPGPSGKLFVQEMMPELEAEADRAGVRRWCETDAGRETNLLYCGRDVNSGRHLFTIDLTRYVRNDLPDAIFHTDRSIELTFDPSLAGEAELVGITDSFERCEGGSASFDANAHILVVRFALPSKLKLVFGKSESGLSLARHPLLIWQGDDLVLLPSGGYGEKQTQEEVRVTPDGDLRPRDVRMLYLVHGDLHKPAFGGGPAFRLSMTKPGSVTVRVNSVSSRAVLRVELDGKEVLRHELTHKGGERSAFAGEYRQDFTVQVPAGDHTIRVDNLGDDWLSVDRYVFRGLR